MIAEPFGRQFDVDAPERVPSAARLAAEAFFAPRTEPAPGEPAPEVVVRKSRLDDVQVPVAAGAGVTREPTRESRVFRLPAPLAATDATQANVQEAAGGAESQPDITVGQLQVAGVPPDRAVGRRKNRRNLHGEVIITRPTAPSAEVASTSEANAMSSLRAPSIAQSSITENSFHADLPSQQWPCYLSLRRQLQALQTQAQAAKMRESQAALVWIHQAIADYGIRPDDLGFGS